MPAQTLSRPYIELSPRIAMVPVVHGVQAYADEVRRAVFEWQPDAIALELPRALSVEIQVLIESLPVIQLLCWQAPGGQSLFLPVEPCDPLIEAARLGDEHELTVEMIDVVSGARGEPWVSLPDDHAISRLGLQRYVEEVVEKLPQQPVTERGRILAARLQVLSERHERVLYVGSLSLFRNLQELLAEGRQLNPHWHEDVPRSEVQQVSGQRLGLALMELPYTAWLYENFRAAHGPEERFPMLDALQEILHQSADTYEEEFDEKVNLTEWRGLYQYGRNLSLVRGGLRPRLEELITAANGCVDGDFAAICLEQATSYPPNADDEPREERQSSLGSPDFHCDFGEGLERLCPCYCTPESTTITFRFRKKPRASLRQKRVWGLGFAGDFFFGPGICSWPPEDEFIERFFRNIRRRAYQQITDRHTTTEEFTSSVLDGLDVRETMRNWHRDRLYVRRERIPPGKVGPVVLVWRDLPLGQPKIWRTCLYAENQNESDIAIYSTIPGEEMVGPGISRIDYYGILSVFPARQIPDVWMEQSLYRFRTSARLLIAAAVLLSEEKYVAVIASQPPDAELRNFARKHGRSLIYLPLTTFSRSLLKRARQCHILSRHDVRKYASDYIPEL